LNLKRQSTDIKHSLHSVCFRISKRLRSVAQQGRGEQVGHAPWAQALEAHQHTLFRY